MQRNTSLVQQREVEPQEEENTRGIVKSGAQETSKAINSSSILRNADLDRDKTKKMLFKICGRQHM